MTLAENIQSLISKIDNFYERPIIIFTGRAAEKATNGSTLYYVDMSEKPDRNGAIKAYYYDNGNKYDTNINKKYSIQNFKKNTWGVLEKGVNDAY